MEEASSAADQCLKTSDTLVSKASTGRRKYWRIHINEDTATDSGVVLVSESWTETATGSESKHRFSAPTVVHGKNVGRSNETTALQQAELEFESAFQKKLKEGYELFVPGGRRSSINPVNSVTGLLLPMLAHDWEKYGDEVKFPCWVQPKIDGIRMLTDGEKCWTRQGNLLPSGVVKHLMPAIKTLVEASHGAVLDGELCLPQGHTFQEVVRAVKKDKPGLTELLKFVVFDIVDETQTQDQRVRVIRGLPVVVGKAMPILTILANDKKELDTIHDAVVHQGFEGAIVRTRDGMYTPKDRSHSLLKYKKFNDSEFEIVAVEEGEGSNKGLAIMVCRTEKGKEFRVTPSEPHDVRRQMWADKDQLVGKHLTVKYQGRSEDGVPRFPTGKAIRDD